MKILVAPLDWGLGHATRCVPVIREFMAQGAEVEIAVVKANAAFFREVFPGLRQRLAPGYNVVYPRFGANMGLWLLKNTAHLNAVMRYEHRYAEEMVDRHGYDILFSDNRFAFYSKKAYNVYMTHQRRIAFPPALSAFEGVGIRWHEARMRHFDEVWVPDVAEFPGYPVVSLMSSLWACFPVLAWIWSKPRRVRRVWPSTVPSLWFREWNPLVPGSRRACTKYCVRFRGGT